MRIKSLLIISLALPILGGCIGEHSGGCDVTENLEILFTYDDAPGEAFTDRITSVDVILSDGRGYFFVHRRASQGGLSAYAGMRFTVPPGRYHAVAWGNVRSNSGFSAFEPGVSVFGSSFVEINPSSTETGDPLYYAPHKDKPAARQSGPSGDGSLAYYAIEVPAGKRTTKVLDFVRAHRTLNVWIKGYRETVAGQDVHPVVRAAGMWTMYDFFFTTQAPRRDFTQQSHTRTVGGVPYAAATFHTALGKIDTATDVILTSPTDGRHIITVNLDRFITDNDITDTDEIDVLIIFLQDQGITVTVPEWGETPVQPGT